MWLQPSSGRGVASRGQNVAQNKGRALHIFGHYFTVVGPRLKMHIKYDNLQKTWRGWRCVCVCVCVCVREREGGGGGERERSRACEDYSIRTI